MQNLHGPIWALHTRPVRKRERRKKPNKNQQEKQENGEMVGRGKNNWEWEESKQLFVPLGTKRKEEGNEEKERIEC
jgi:hypothetical protein